MQNTLHKMLHVRYDRMRPKNVMARRQRAAAKTDQAETCTINATDTGNHGRSEQGRNGIAEPHHHRLPNSTSNLTMGTFLKGETNGTISGADRPTVTMQEVEIKGCLSTVIVEFCIAVRLIPTNSPCIEPYQMDFWIRTNIIISRSSKPSLNVL